MSLAAVMLAVVIGVTLSTSLERQVNPSPAAVMEGDTWFPVAGTTITFYKSSGLQTVVTLTKVSAHTFDPSTARFFIVESDGHSTPPYTATAEVKADTYTVVITASNFSVTSTGKSIRFQISYTDDPGSYSSATYPLMALSNHLYIPLVTFYPDGKTPCSAYPANPQTAYPIAQDQQYRFFSITLPVTSTVNVTATNYKVSNGQMQMRLRPANSCVTTGTDYVLNYMTMLITKTNNSFATYNMAPGNYLVRFSADTFSSTPFTFTWSYVGGRGPYELNNTLCTAALITPGNTLYAYPDDKDDFYYFDSGLSNATIQATISGYNIPGQYQLIKEKTSCSDVNWPPLNTQSASLGTVTMPITSQTPGRYYLRILATNQFGFNQSQAYTFKVSMSTGLSASSLTSTPNQSVEMPTPVPLPEEGKVETSSSTDQVPAP